MFQTSSERAPVSICFALWFFGHCWTCLCWKFDLFKIDKYFVWNKRDETRYSCTKAVVYFDLSHGTQESDLVLVWSWRGYQGGPIKIEKIKEVQRYSFVEERKSIFILHLSFYFMIRPEERIGDVPDTLRIPWRVEVWKMSNSPIKVPRCEDLLSLFSMNLEPAKLIINKFSGQIYVQHLNIFYFFSVNYAYGGPLLAEIASSNFWWPSRKSNQLLA